ncbi:MAG: transglutaminase domain-containing protein [Candidatus Sulfotelmatobacter sp.]
MIAETVPEAYDANGHQVSPPFVRRKGPHPTFPMGRYVSQPLTIQCTTIDEIRKFLIGCDYVSDRELLGKNDYWQPPEEFEKRKKGDCEDFAVWTWRQLLNMGYDARFIGGKCGRYGEGHAWVEYFQDGKCFLLEPLYCRVGTAVPRLSTLRYVPKLSVSWDGSALRYFAHKKPESHVAWQMLAPLVGGYLLFWGWFWFGNFFSLPKVAWKILRRKVFKRELWLQRKRRRGY